MPLSGISKNVKLTSFGAIIKKIKTQQKAYLQAPCFHFILFVFLRLEFTFLATFLTSLIGCLALFS